MDSGYFSFRHSFKCYRKTGMTPTACNRDFGKRWIKFFGIIFIFPQEGDSPKLR